MISNDNVTISVSVSNLGILVPRSQELKIVISMVSCKDIIKVSDDLCKLQDL